VPCFADAGDTRAVKLQLVLLPPFAADITPESPPQLLKELHHGITLRKSACMKRGVLQYYKYSIEGLPLSASEPYKNSWFLRGEVQVLLFRAITRVQA
jgi:hypothetical protein